VPWSWKSRAIHLPTLWATTRPVKGTLYLYIHRILHVTDTDIEVHVYETFVCGVIYWHVMCVYRAFG